MCYTCKDIEANETVHHREEHADAANVLVCFRTSKKIPDGDDNDRDRPSKKKPTKLKPSKSRELRASILYVGCDCEKRNGLQDQCPRKECRGSPECLTIPPTCIPSQYANGKHLQRMYEKRLKEIEEAKKKKHEKEKERANPKIDNARKSNEEDSDSKYVNYKCYSLELLKKGEACPICKQPMSHQTKSEPKNKNIDQQIEPLYIKIKKGCNKNEAKRLACEHSSKC